MKLGDIWPVPADKASNYALVFTVALAERLAELHSRHGTPNCVPSPRIMQDGRLMLCADVLTEVQPGGLLHAMWEAADKKVLMETVEVVTWDEAVAMLPPDPTPAPE